MKKILLFFLMISIVSTAPLKASGMIEEDTPRIKVLSWDGGGVRGLFSLYVAQAIDDQIGGSVSLVDQADWLVGTSTGGIIALALANGSSLQEAINLYKNNGTEIFKQDGWSFWRQLRSLWEETYTDTGLVNQLHQTLGAQTKFADLQKKVIVTSYDVHGGEIQHPSPYIFNSQDPALATVDIWKAARATSAAPSYFDPYCGFDGHVLIDGGVIANHPGRVGVDGILSLAPLEERDDMLGQIDMVSLGTGVFYEPMTATQAQNRGKLDWAGPISGLMMQGVSDLVDEGLRLQLGQHYIRLNTTLNRPIPLDAVAEDDLRALENLALTYVQENPEAIDYAANLMLL